MDRIEINGRGGVWILNWARNHGRVQDLARLLNASPVSVYPNDWFSRRSTVLRYVVSFFRTIQLLQRGKPDALIVMSPPVPAAAVGVTWARLNRATVILDCHPGSFGLQNDKWSARLGWLHRWAVKRAKAVMVTTPDLVSEVSSMGGRGLVFHEAVPAIQPGQGIVRKRSSVLFPGTFARDEPIELVMAAARLLPTVEFRVTGEFKKCPSNIRAAAPQNVTFLGYLGLYEYATELASASVLLALTTENQSVQRSAWEAGYFGTPLVVSDTPAARFAFPEATAVDHRVDRIVAALTELLENDHIARARSELLARRLEQVLVEQTDALVRATRSAA